MINFEKYNLQKKLRFFQVVLAYISKNLHVYINFKASHVQILYSMKKHRLK